MKFSKCDKNDQIVQAHVYVFVKSKQSKLDGSKEFRTLWIKIRDAANSRGALRGAANSTGAAISENMVSVLRCL